MANNRMYLICNYCQPEGKEWPSTFSEEFKAFFHIAKWYPCTPWYIANEKEYAGRLNAFFERHMHPEIEQAGVEHPVRLEYES